MAQSDRGSDVSQALQLVEHGLWDHPAMDPNSCGVVHLLAPIGPWTHSEYSTPLPRSFLLYVHIEVCLRCMNCGANAPNRCKP